MVATQWKIFKVFVPLDLGRHSGLNRGMDVQQLAGAIRAEVAELETRCQHLRAIADKIERDDAHAKAPNKLQRKTLAKAFNKLLPKPKKS